MKILMHLLTLVLMWYAVGLAAAYIRVIWGMCAWPGVGTDLWLEAMDSSKIGELSRLGNELFKHSDYRLQVLIGLTAWPERLYYINQIWPQMTESYMKEYQRLLAEKLS